MADGAGIPAVAAPQRAPPGCQRVKRGCLASVHERSLPLSSDEVTARDTFQRLRVRYAPYANAITELLLCDLGSYQPDPLPGRPRRVMQWVHWRGTRLHPPGIGR